jgi:hypothetical protein
MGALHYKPKKNLAFRALLNAVAESVESIEDKRNKEKCTYTLKDAYISAFAMFYLQDPSLLEFQRRFQEQIQKNNLVTVFGVNEIPSDTQLRTIIDNHDYEPIMKVFFEYLSRLQRGKVLEQYKHIGGKYLITIDGSDYFHSESVTCRKCLKKETREGVHYHHQILQSTIVHPDKRQVVPLRPEFIRNGDGKAKQDRELVAGKRLIGKLRASHPMLEGVIVGDDLYSNQPFIETIKKKGFSFLLVAKPTSHKSLYEDVEGLRRSKLLNRYEYTDGKGRKHIYEWENGLVLNGREDSVRVNFVEYTIIEKGKVNYRNSFVTDMEIREDNVKEIVLAGRARWKIENEGFNTLKNHGYHLEHNFGHGENNLSEAFFLLNLIAFFMHQIFELTDRMYREARSGFGSRREYWNIIRSVFKLFIFMNWEQVLERINAPPGPING